MAAGKRFSLEGGSCAGGAAGGKGGCRTSWARRGAHPFGTSGRVANPESRPHKVGSITACAHRGQRHGGGYEEEDPSDGGCPSWSCNSCGCECRSVFEHSASDFGGSFESSDVDHDSYDNIGGACDSYSYDFGAHVFYTGRVHDVLTTSCLGAGGSTQGRHGYYGGPHAGDDGGSGCEVPGHVVTGVPAHRRQQRNGDGWQHGLGTNLPGQAPAHRPRDERGNAGDGSSTSRPPCERIGGPGSFALNQSLASPNLPDYKVNAASLKTGVKQMISQAWQRHRKEQLAVSVTNTQLHEAMLVEETSTFTNDTFVAQLVMPDLSFAEVFTDTEPVLQQARLRGHRALEPLSLRSGWDFRVAAHRTMALDTLRRSRPYMVIIAFPCGPWSPLQQLTAEPALLHKKRKEARVLVDFAADVARLQLSQHVHFVMENPDPSLAWTLRSLTTLAGDPRVMAVRLDQCRYGLRPASGARFEVPKGAEKAAARQRKRTRLLTSSQAVVSTFLGKFCRGQGLHHFHVPVMGGS